MKKKYLILSMLLWISAINYVFSQDLMNFYLEPNANNNSVTLNTNVFRSMETIYQTISTQTNGNEIDVSICYRNTAVATITFDHQEFPISLPAGFSSYIINVNLFGDDDGLPCENNNLVDFGSVSFDYPYNPTETTFIPDDNFETYLEDTFSGDGVSANNLVFTHRIENISMLLLNDQFISVDPIESLIGIEDIPRLQYLHCEDNLLSTLNVSMNSNLIELICGQNLINVLNVSNNLLLKKLWCGFNNLTALDVTNNLLLESLSFSSDGLTQIDLSQNSNLKFLNFNGNNLNGINLSGNPNLITLGIGTSQFTELDLSNNILLEDLGLFNTSILSLDLVNNIALINFDSDGGELGSLNVTGLTNLKDLFCNDSQLTTLDLSTNTGLERIQLIQNDLSSLNLKNGNNPNITTLITIANSNLYCIDVDDENEAPYPGWIVDSQTDFSEDCLLGIDDNLNENISIYPNPVIDFLKIDNTSNAEISSIKFYDVLGRIVLDVNEEYYQIDVSHLNSGVLFVKIVTDQGIVANKIIKD